MLPVQSLQPWDEALYAVRVKYIVETNQWLDQTTGSVDGLYSSSQPPLQMWLAAATAKIFGLNLFSIRLWPLLFFLGTLILLFYFFNDRKTGLIASLFLGTVPFFQAYARLGQLDMGAIFFLTASLFFLEKFRNNGKTISLLWAGAMAGLAFMAKMWLGILSLLPFSFWMAQLVFSKQKSTGTALKEWLVFFFPAVLIPLPWHLFMYLRYGSSFLDYFFFFHVVKRVGEGVEHNTVALGPVFFINQLLVMLSAGWAFLIYKLVKEKNIPPGQHLLWWFWLSAFIIFSISATKLRTYSLPVLPALSMLMAIAFTSGMKQKKIPAWIIFISLALLAWSSSQGFRDAVSQLAFTKTIFLLPVIAVIIISAISLLVRVNDKTFIYLVIAFLMLRFTWVKPVEYTQHQLDQISAYYYDRDFDRLVYVDTKRTADDPLITYYFNGINLHSRDDFVMVRPEQKPPFELSYKNRNSLILINLKHRNPDYAPLEKEIASKAIPMFGSKSYAAYIW